MKEPHVKQLPKLRVFVPTNYPFAGPIWQADGGKLHDLRFDIRRSFAQELDLERREVSRLRRQ